MEIYNFNHEWGPRFSTAEMQFSTAFSNKFKLFTEDAVTVEFFCIT